MLTYFSGDTKHYLQNHISIPARCLNGVDVIDWARIKALLFKRHSRQPFCVGVGTVVNQFEKRLYAIKQNSDRILLQSQPAICLKLKISKRKTDKSSWNPLVPACSVALYPKMDKM